MTIQVKAHFDGHAIVPDEPLDIPVNQPLTVQVSVEAPAIDMKEAEAAFQQLLGMVVHNANISAESLRRENMYEDD